MILVDKKWEYVVQNGTARFSILNKDPEKWRRDFEKREEFRTGVSWHIPTESLIESLKQYSPIVSVGCGLGYSETLALERGADIILTDLSPGSDNRWCKVPNNIFPEGIIRIGAKEAVKKFNDRNLFMAWPPYDTPMAYEAANALEINRYLIYVGESEGGCNGDQEFFKLLQDNFEIVECEAYVPSWDGIYDNVYIYRKIKK